MHYMHYKDYIHHGLAAEKTPPPLPQGEGEPSGWVGGGVGVPAHIYIYVCVYVLERPLGTMLLHWFVIVLEDQTGSFQSPKGPWRIQRIEGGAQQ